MKILITGGTGLIGKAIAKKLIAKGHELVLTSRNPEKAKEQFSFPCQWISWNPETEILPQTALSEVNAVIHLAGESIAEKNWNEKVKGKIRNSRVLGTQHLVQSLIQRRGKPIVLLCASAIGIYGNRGEEQLSEFSSPGHGFLSELCVEWEKTAQQLPYGMGRVVILRIGAVLAREGGLLGKLLPLFKAGAGVNIGQGDQWLSWIHIQDLASLMLYCIENPAIEGVLNAVSPHPVRNQEFAKLLSDYTGKRIFMKAPKRLLTFFLGEMAEELLLSSQAVFPEKTKSTGFSFEYSDIKSALTNLLLPSMKEKNLKEFCYETWVPEPIDRVFSFFSEGKNLSQLTPPQYQFQWIHEPSHSLMQEGTEFSFKLKWHGVIPIRWKSRVETCLRNKEIIDVQLQGPYRSWKHSHQFEAIQGGTLIRNTIYYSLPGGVLGKRLMGRKIHHNLKQFFQYRKETLKKIFSQRI